MKKWINRLGVGFGSLIVIVAVAAVIWASDYADATAQAFSALDSSSDVSVAQENWISFTPVDSTPTTGFIFYPGGKVDERAYAPTMVDIAEAGYLVVLVPMPLKLAFVAPNKADSIIEAYPEIEHWVIGGHSLGGAMAARYLHSHPEMIDGLVLWAAYPAESNDLSDFDQAVVSIMGTRDGFATPEKIDARVHLLPADTIYIPIEGGNHAQFGFYDDQEGDNPATISQEEQQEQTLAGTLLLLEMVSRGE